MNSLISPIEMKRDDYEEGFIRDNYVLPMEG
jgi:hypothetical protein